MKKGNKKIIKEQIDLILKKLVDCREKGRQKDYKTLTDLLSRMIPQYIYYIGFPTVEDFDYFKQVKEKCENERESISQICTELINKNNIHDYRDINIALTNMIRIIDRLEDDIENIERSMAHYLNRALTSDKK
ncbi:hypothetical protein ABEV41_00250 [Geobacillus thermodenitrificans]|jgi:hypothetical protein|uniref:hypothetical protein n=1 Tax=Geobacillus thermodenitrificans TaxID=33940 RepID=UPI003D247194